jgi:hypothetical protein
MWIKYLTYIEKHSMNSPTLNQFRSEINARNVARPSHYYVQIVPPPIFRTSKIFPDPKLISMWCSQANTPQTTISTRDDYLENGVRRKYAYDQDFQNLTLHFYLDADFEIQKFFDDWKYAVVPQRRKFNYPDDYTAASLNLFIINQAGEDTYKYEFSRIFPKSINSVDLSYASCAGVSTFSVDFVYETYYYTSNVVDNEVAINRSSKPDTQIETPALPANRELVQQTNVDPNGFVINTEFN